MAMAQKLRTKNPGLVERKKKQKLWSCLGVFFLTHSQMLPTIAEDKSHTQSLKSHFRLSSVHLLRQILVPEAIKNACPNF